MLMNAKIVLQMCGLREEEGWLAQNVQIHYRY